MGSNPYQIELCICRKHESDLGSLSILCCCCNVNSTKSVCTSKFVLLLLLLLLYIYIIISLFVYLFDPNDLMMKRDSKKDARACQQFDLSFSLLNFCFVYIKHTFQCLCKYDFTVSARVCARTRTFNLQQFLVACLQFEFITVYTVGPYVCTLFNRRY